MKCSITAIPIASTPSLSLKYAKIYEILLRLCFDLFIWFPKTILRGRTPPPTGNSLRPRDVTRQARSTRQRTAGPGLGAGSSRAACALTARPVPGRAPRRGGRLLVTGLLRPPLPALPVVLSLAAPALTAGRGTWPWCDPAPHDCSCGFYHLWPPVKLPDCGLDYSTPSFRTKLRKSVVDTRYCYYSHVGLEDLVLTLEELKELGELNIKSSN